MPDPRAELLRSLLHGQRLAALGTLHGGRPAVSMVPFALAPARASVVLHVSRLATHTRDMSACPEVGLMVMATPDAATLPQALPRISLAGHARPCAPEDAEYAAARAAYLERFPESEPLFGFGDFSLFLVEPESVRLVGGFAQAWSLVRAQYLQFMSDGA